MGKTGLVVQRYNTMHMLERSPSTEGVSVQGERRLRKRPTRTSDFHSSRAVQTVLPRSLTCVAFEVERSIQG